MADNYRVPVTIPNVPANCVKLIEELIAELDRAHGSLHTSAGNLQTFMGQASGAVQNVATTSEGKATRALSDTWHYTRMDGNHAHSGMTGAATHLSDASTKLSTYLPALRTGMSIMQAVTSQGGKVMVGEASQIEGQLSDFTTALNNVGLALEGAATLLNTLSGNIPTACATGFNPKGPHPVFAGNAFDGEHNNGKANMSGESGGGNGNLSQEDPQQIINELQLNGVTKEQVQQRISELGDLANEFSPEQLKAILQTKGLSDSEGMTLTYSKAGKTGEGHTLEKHVNVTDKELEQLASKSNRDGGVGVATRFTNQKVAQQGIDLTIANSQELQDFIKNGQPNTVKVGTYDGQDNQVFGSGYQRIVLNRGRQFKAQKLPEPLRRVTVVLAKNADGEIFVLSAHPAQ